MRWISPRIKSKMHMHVVNCLLLGLNRSGHMSTMPVTRLSTIQNSLSMPMVCKKRNLAMLFSHSRFLSSVLYKNGRHFSAFNEGKGWCVVKIQLNLMLEWVSQGKFKFFHPCFPAGQLPSSYSSMCKILHPFQISHIWQVFKTTTAKGKEEEMRRRRRGQMFVFGY